jgi:hypothetical protein
MEPPPPAPFNDRERMLAARSPVVMELQSLRSPTRQRRLESCGSMADLEVLMLGVDGLMPELERVHEQLDILLALAPRTVVVDISQLCSPSSTSVAALLWIRRRCSERGVDVVLRGTAKRNQEAFRALGFLASPRPAD